MTNKFSNSFSAKKKKITKEQLIILYFVKLRKGQEVLENISNVC